MSSPETSATADRATDASPDPGPGLEGYRPAAVPGRLPSWGGFLVFAAVFAYSWFGDHRQYVTDDAGIFLRYAERMAEGKGFSYNDGEAVNGVSAPVFVLAEALCLRLGFTPEDTILLIASLCLAATAGLLFATFARFYSPGAAGFSVLALLAFEWPFGSAVDGMETPVVTLLVALLFRALHAAGPVPVGLALGALAANKLDGSLAAIAFAAVYVAARRRFPWRTASIALLAAAPVFGLLLARFGSILPNSMLVKMLVHSNLRAMDHLWMHKLMSGYGWRVLYWGAWASMAWLPLARRLVGSFAIAVTQAWFVLHMVTYSVVNLGEPYPWYTAAPMALSVILATFLFHLVASAVLVRTPVPRLAWDPASPPRRMWPVSLVLLGGLGWRCLPRLSIRLRRPAAPHLVERSTTLDLGRQAAGAWLRKNSSGTELFSTFEGLPAFEYGGPCYDFSRLNSAWDPGRQASAVYELLGPQPVKEGALPRFEPGFDRELVATFRFDLADGYYLLYAKPQSEVQSRGARHLLFPTPVLRAGGSGAGLGDPIDQKGNTWLLQSTGLAHFEVESPGPPTLLLAMRIVRAQRRPALAGDRVRWTIRSGGVELASGELSGGAAPAPVQATARASGSGADSPGRYSFEIECRDTGSQGPGEVYLEASEVLVRYGEPVRAADFKLSIPRCRNRVDHVASFGMPQEFFGW